MTKLERDADAIVKKMADVEKEIDAFSERKLTLPPGVAWGLLRAAVSLGSAVAKLQLKAAKRTVTDTKRHFGATT